MGDTIYIISDDDDDEPPPSSVRRLGHSTGVQTNGNGRSSGNGNGNGNGRSSDTDSDIIYIPSQSDSDNDLNVSTRKGNNSPIPPNDDNSDSDLPDVWADDPASHKGKIRPEPFSSKVESREPVDCKIEPDENLTDQDSIQVKSDDLSHDEGDKISIEPSSPNVKPQVSGNHKGRKHNKNWLEPNGTMSDPDGSGCEPSTSKVKSKASWKGKGWKQKRNRMESTGTLSDPDANQFELSRDPVVQNRNWKKPVETLRELDGNQTKPDGDPVKISGNQIEPVESNVSQMAGSMDGDSAEDEGNVITLGDFFADTHGESQVEPVDVPYEEEQWGSLESNAADYTLDQSLNQSDPTNVDNSIPKKSDSPSVPSSSQRLDSLNPGYSLPHGSPKSSRRRPLKIKLKDSPNSGWRVSAPSQTGHSSESKRSVPASRTLFSPHSAPRHESSDDDHTHSEDVPSTSVGEGEISGFPLESIIGSTSSPERTRPKKERRNDLRESTDDGSTTDISLDSSIRPTSSIERTRPKRNISTIKKEIMNGSSESTDDTMSEESDAKGDPEWKIDERQKLPPERRKVRKRKRLLRTCSSASNAGFIQDHNDSLNSSDDEHLRGRHPRLQIGRRMSQRNVAPRLQSSSLNEEPMDTASDEEIHKQGRLLSCRKKAVVSESETNSDGTHIDDESLNQPQVIKSEPPESEETLIGNDASHVPTVTSAEAGRAIKVETFTGSASEAPLSEDVESGSETGQNTAQCVETFVQRKQPYHCLTPVSLKTTDNQHKKLSSSKKGSSHQKNWTVDSKEGRNASGEVKAPADSLHSSTKSNRKAKRKLNIPDGKSCENSPLDSTKTRGSKISDERVKVLSAGSSCITQRSSASIENHLPGRKVPTLCLITVKTTASGQNYESSEDLSTEGRTDTARDHECDRAEVLNGPCPKNAKNKTNKNAKSPPDEIKIPSFYALSRGKKTLQKSFSKENGKSATVSGRASRRVDSWEEFLRKTPDGKGQKECLTRDSNPPALSEIDEEQRQDGEKEADALPEPNAYDDFCTQPFSLHDDEGNSSDIFDGAEDLHTQPFSPTLSNESPSSPSMTGNTFGATKTVNPQDSRLLSTDEEKQLSSKASLDRKDYFPTDSQISCQSSDDEVPHDATNSSPDEGVTYGSRRSNESPIEDRSTPTEEQYLPTDSQLSNDSNNENSERMSSQLENPLVEESPGQYFPTDSQLSIDLNSEDTEEVPKNEDTRITMDGQMHSTLTEGHSSVAISDNQDGKKKLLPCQRNAWSVSDLDPQQRFLLLEGADSEYQTFTPENEDVALFDEETPSTILDNSACDTSDEQSKKMQLDELPASSMDTPGTSGTAMDKPAVSQNSVQPKKNIQKKSRSEKLLSAMKETDYQQKKNTRKTKPQTNSSNTPARLDNKQSPTEETIALKESSANSSYMSSEGVKESAGTSSKISSGPLIDSVQGETHQSESNISSHLASETVSLPNPKSTSVQKSSDSTLSTPSPTLYLENITLPSKANDQEGAAWTSVNASNGPTTAHDRSICLSSSHSNITESSTSRNLPIPSSAPSTSTSTPSGVISADAGASGPRGVSRSSSETSDRCIPLKKRRLSGPPDVSSAPTKTQVNRELRREDILSCILSWNTEWYQEHIEVPSAEILHSLMNVKELPKNHDSYPDVRSYQETFLCFLLIEMWTKVSKSIVGDFHCLWKQSSQAIPSQDIIKVQYELDGNQTESHGMRNGDLILIDMTTISATQKQYQFGLVQIAEPGARTVCLALHKDTIVPSSTRLKVVTSLAHYLNQAQALLSFSSHPLARHIIKPDDPTVFTNSEETQNVQLSDDELRGAYMESVTSTAKRSEVIRLMNGPPGTGKTTFLHRLVRWITKIHKAVPKTAKNLFKLLVCAPTSQSLDVLLRKIWDALMKHSAVTRSMAAETWKMSKIRRLHHERRLPGKEHIVDGVEIVRVGEAEHADFRLTDFLLSNVVMRMREQGAPYNKMTEVELQTKILQRADIVGCTLEDCGMEVVKDSLAGNVFVVIIDDASHCLETEILLALQCRTKRIFMAGDQDQGLVHIHSQEMKDLGYGRSMLERLAENFEIQDRRIHRWEVQYRMKEEIARFPSSYIYLHRLKTREKDISFFLRPYVVFDVADGKESHTQESVINISEVAFIDALVSRFPKVKEQYTVGIIAPSIGQKNKLEERFKGRQVNSLLIGTPTEFYGLEKDVIILSCTITSDENRFLMDKQTLNLALTRAKLSLIIVCNRKSLMKMKGHWESLMMDATDRRLVYGTLQASYSADAANCHSKTTLPGPSTSRSLQDPRMHHNQPPRTLGDRRPMGPPGVEPSRDGEYSYRQRHNPDLRMNPGHGAGHSAGRDPMAAHAVLPAELNALPWDDPGSRSSNAPWNTAAGGGKQSTASIQRDSHPEQLSRDGGGMYAGDMQDGPEGPRHSSGAAAVESHSSGHAARQRHPSGDAARQRHPSGDAAGLDRGIKRVHFEAGTKDNERAAKIPRYESTLQGNSGGISASPAAGSHPMTSSSRGTGSSGSILRKPDWSPIKNGHTGFHNLRSQSGVDHTSESLPGKARAPIGEQHNLRSQRRPASNEAVNGTIGPSLTYAQRHRRGSLNLGSTFNKENGKTLNSNAKGVQNNQRTSNQQKDINITSQNFGKRTSPRIARKGSSEVHRTETNRSTEARSPSTSRNMNDSRAEQDQSSDRRRHQAQADQRPQQEEDRRPRRQCRQEQPEPPQRQQQRMASLNQLATNPGHLDPNMQHNRNVHERFGGRSTELTEPQPNIRRRKRSNSVKDRQMDYPD